MNGKYSANYLRRIRNEISIARVIEDALEIPTKTSEGYLRFLCPVCSEFNTAVNPATNLARCFRCKQNFNPIDMTMTVKGYSFLDAVEFLTSLL
jgi:DNA primase